MDPFYVPLTLMRGAFSHTHSTCLLHGGAGYSIIRVCWQKWYAFPEDRLRYEFSFFSVIISLL